MDQTLTGPILPAIETPPEIYGISHFWEMGDLVIRTVAIVLLIMSVLSWAQIALKCWRAAHRRSTTSAVENFWQAASLESAVAGLTGGNRENPFADIARQALLAASHFDMHSGKTIGGSTDRSEFLIRAIRQSIVRSTARLESGLTMLASIGSIAPFVGLFGTVWGIYHALLSIAATGSASIDKVSGPVGEALIMTAAGLFVAIPAVLAYNAFTRVNRIELAQLDGFAHDLHAYLDTGQRMAPHSNLHSNLRIVETEAP